MARPPKPTALKVIAGNPGKRAINKQEPDPEYLNDLTPPAHMSEAAKAVWSEVAPPLRRSKVLTELDRPALEMMCNAIATYRLAVEKTGDSPLAKSGEQQTQALSPWMIVQSMSHKQAFAMLREFGRSPAARSRVLIQPQKDMFNEGEGPARFFG